MRVKICGIRDAEQGQAIARLGATALGFICVSQSPRYVTASEIRTVVDALPTNDTGIPIVDRVGVFVDASINEIHHTVSKGNLNVVQLHGHETPSTCQQIREQIPSIELIKAFRVRNPETLNKIQSFADSVDSFLLDAYHPNMMGGTGQTLNWSALKSFQSDRPWFLAGGLTPDNVTNAITLLSPDGIDLSSGVEITPGNKDLRKVEALFNHLNRFQY